MGTDEDNDIGGMTLTEALDELLRLRAENRRMKAIADEIQPILERIGRRMQHISDDLLGLGTLRNEIRCVTNTESDRRMNRPELLRKVRALVKEGYTQEAIAIDLGITQGFVSKILAGIVKA